MPNGRVVQQITDISSVRQLLCYATAGQIAQLCQRLRVSQGRVAQGAGFGQTPASAGPALTRALGEGPSVRRLEQLDEIIGALAPDVERTGGLCSLFLRLSADRRPEVMRSLFAHIPPSWTGMVLRDPPASEVEVLIQASALLAAFMAADNLDMGGQSTGRIRDRYHNDIDQLARRLIMISVAPPTTMNHDAQILLGSLASYAFEQLRDNLDYQVRYSPLGFRVWRAITKLVTLTTRPEHSAALQAWVRALLRDSEKLRSRSLYAGRSLDLELAISVPARWSPPEDDWVRKVLLTRAMNAEATIRERGTAAMGLWQRAVGQNRTQRESVEADLRRLIGEFKDPGSRPDASAGLRWVAATLDHVIHNGDEAEGKGVCNDWPAVDEPWFANVQEAADELDTAEIPDHLREATKSLFRHMVLQNAGVYRRQAIETVITGGWSDPVARALGSLLEKERNEAWLRIRAEFALGFLELRDRRVEESLVGACKHAHAVLRADGMAADGNAPPRAHRTELHSSLFAVGDCFGAPGAEEAARRVRDKLSHVLGDLAGMEGDQARILRRPARAAAYLLMVTAQPRDGKEKDLSETLLEKLSGHPDDVTAELSKWALKVRFSPEGQVRSLLEAQ
jgi:hypothetical protein